jgi:1,4-dihydroxy-2-naphthoyl-CoA hydrolase
MTFIYQRKIRFGDTDAAGVMYFSNALSICHEAYEESLAQWGIDLREFFSHGAIAVPITHASIDYRRPAYCGDMHWVHVCPAPISETEFEVVYYLYGGEAESLLLSQAKTCHVCINRGDRQRMPLPDELMQWMDWCNEQ